MRSGVGVVNERLANDRTRQLRQLYPSHLGLHRYSRVRQHCGLAVMTPLRKVDPETEYLRCTGHPACEGARLREDHDEVCDSGDECTDDECWRGCPFCLNDKRDVN